MLLVTNNIDARDAYGQPSHVWIVHLLQEMEREPGRYCAYSEEWAKVEGITHWMYLDEALSTPASEMSAQSEGYPGIAHDFETMCRLLKEARSYVASYAGAPGCATAANGLLLEIDNAFAAPAPAVTGKAHPSPASAGSEQRAAAPVQPNDKVGCPDCATARAAANSWKDELMRLKVERSAITAGAADVLAERRRQVEAEGWDAKHDDAHGPATMAVAGACYALSYASVTSKEHVAWRDRYGSSAAGLWPWDVEWFKPKLREPRRDLVRAAALLLAEIERLDRAATDRGSSNG